MKGVFRMAKRILAWVLIAALLVPLPLSHVPTNAKAADLEQGGNNATELVHQITYEVNGGTMPETAVATIYTAESEVVLPTPTKEGYTFAGWYESEDFSGEAVATTAGAVGDKIFYAKWEAAIPAEEQAAEVAVVSEKVESAAKTMTMESEISTTDLSADGKWTIKMNWGDPGEDIPDDYCLTLDKELSKVVKCQVTVEYRGDGTEVFAPEEIKINVPSLYSFFDRYTVDISAEKKGSGSGIGDWYYSELGYQDSKYYQFTNKTEITDSYTSTFQMVYTFVSPDNKIHLGRYLDVDDSKDVTAELVIGDNTLNSNTLHLSWEGVQDIYYIQWQKPTALSWGNQILSKIPRENWDDYIFINAPLYMFFDENGPRSYYLKSGYRVELTIPDGIIIGDVPTKDSYFSLLNAGRSDLSWFGTTLTADERGGISIPLAVPRTMLEQITIDIKADLYGTYNNETEEKFLSTDTISILLADFDVEYTGELYSVEKTVSDTYGYLLYRDVLENGYGKDTLIGNSQGWSLKGSAIYYGVKYNVVVGDDSQYFVFEDGAYRRVNKDEMIIERLTIYRPLDADCDYEVYVMEAGSDAYTLFTSGTLTDSSETIMISNDAERYCSIRVKYLGLEGTYKNKSLMHIQTRTYTDKDKNNGKSVEKLLNIGYLQIELYDENGSAYPVEMECDFTSNIDGLAKEVNAYYQDTYKGTVLLDYNSLTVQDAIYDVFISQKSGQSVTKVSEDFLKFNNGWYGRISDYTDLGYAINKARLKVKNPDYADIDMDSIQIYYTAPITSGHNGAYTVSIKEFEERYSANVSISETVNNDFTKSVELTIDFDNMVSGDDLSSVGFIADYYISMDDYKMLDLGGKSFKQNGYIFYDNGLYCEVTDRHHSLSSDWEPATFSVPETAFSSQQGVAKYVKTDSEYSKSLQKTGFGENYTYKLRIASGYTRTAHITLYDNLENYDETSWKGIFNGISFATLEQAGIDTSLFEIYYSSSRNQTMDISADGWILSTEWTGELADVKSIAVDLQGYVLESNSLVYIEVNMKAPTGGVELGEATKNQYTASYEEYDATDAGLSNPLKVTTNLPSNITSVSMGDAVMSVNVNKIWSDENNVGDTRPESVAIHLYRNGTEVDTYELTSEEEWKHTFSGLRKFDDSQVEYEYTVTEDSITGYTENIEYITGDTKLTVNITNTIETVDIKGEKVWEDDNDLKGLRPDTITVHLLRDGTKVRSTTTDAAKGWKYSFEGVPKFKGDGIDYVYSVEEEAVEGYTASYETTEVKGIRLTFSEDCETESKNYDYVQIFYEIDGKYYQAAKLGGKGSSNTIAGAVVEVPTTDFYLYWYTDYSNCDYYGYKIASIEAIDTDVTGGFGVTSLPSSKVIETNALPESVHDVGKKGYGNNLKELYHYNSNLVPQYNVINTLEETEKELTIVKTIAKDEIWWEHGNPTFIFEIAGSGFTKYISMEFTQEFVDEHTDENGNISLETTLTLPEGDYTVTEVPVMRWQLKNVSSESAKSILDNGAIIDLSNDATVEFVNKYSSYAGYSHNDIVVNNVCSGGQ